MSEMISTLDFNPVLTVFPYALLYYALLLASSGLALAAVLHSHDDRKTSLLISLAVIFISQLVLLTANLLAYQRFEPIVSLFPLLHRILNLVCLFWLVWLIFRLREASLSAWLPLITTVLILLFSAFLTLWWLPVFGSQNFNFSWVDYFWITLTLLLILSAAVVYLKKYGFSSIEPLLILSISAAGFILYLFLPMAGNLPAVVMLSQLLYYPLLISFVRQAPGKQPSEVGNASDNNLKQNQTLRSNVANTFLEVSLQSERDGLEKSLSHGLSLYLMADLLGFLSYQEGSQFARLSNTYDLIREEHLPPIELPVQRIPALFSAMQNMEIVFSNQEGDFQVEKTALTDLSGYNQVGNLLYYPVHSTKDSYNQGVLGLSPYTNKAWHQEDLNRLDHLKENVGKVLYKAIELEKDSAQLQQLIVDLEEKTQKLKLLDQEYTNSQADLEQIKKDLELTQSAWAEEVVLWVNRQKEMEEELESLQASIEENLESAAQVETLKLQKQHLEETILRNANQVGQLKTVLKQAGFLINNLTQSPGGILDVQDEENPPTGLESND